MTDVKIIKVDKSEKLYEIEQHDDDQVLSFYYKNSDDVDKISEILASLNIDNSELRIYINGHSDEDWDICLNKLMKYKDNEIHLKKVGLSICTSEKLQLYIDKYKYFENVHIDGLFSNESYISYEYCGESLREYNDALNTLNNMIKTVCNDNLSPLEQVLYVYDRVRDRIYIMETENDDTKLSRNLTSVLLQEKIVCQGYAEILNKTMKLLGFDCMIDYSYSNHARNIIRINDAKYDLDNFFFFDATWDRKKDETDDHFYRYNYFGRTYKEMYDNGLIHDNNLRDIYERIFNANICVNPITGELFVSDEDYHDIDKEIDCRAFAQALITVRKKQCKEAPKKFDNSIDGIITILYNRDYIGDKSFSFNFIENNKFSNRAKAKKYLNKLQNN